jgi:hypothetical protein
MDKKRSDMINKLESILKEIDKKISLASSGYLKNEEVKELVIKIRKEFDSLFLKDSIPHRRYLRLREEKDDKWWKEEKTTFVTENSSNYCRLFNWQYIVKDLLKICDPEALEEYISKQNNYYYSRGNFYEAKRMVIKIMRSANKSIVIIDPYLDDIIFNYIDLIDEEIDIKLVTSQIKKIFKELLNDLKNIRKNIDARQSEGFHDRYIIIDGKEIWNLGTSINYIGKNAFQINKVTEEETINKIMKDYNLWWKNGKDLNC